MKCYKFYKEEIIVMGLLCMKSAENKKCALAMAIKAWQYIF